MNTENMNVWNHACKTDTAATKTSRVEGRQVTSISTLWPIQKATELWGPCGNGWGYEIVEERYDTGAPIMYQPDPNQPPAKLCDSINHTLRINLWYMDGEKRCEVTEFGHTKYVYRSRYGASEDPEAPKKSLSDAIKKALSMLGFSADVYMGQFDDAEYMEQLKTEEEIEKAEKKDEAALRKQVELKEYVEKQLEMIANASRVSEVNGIVKVAVRHLERQKTIPALNKIAERGLKAIARDAETKNNLLKKAA